MKKLLLTALCIVLSTVNLHAAPAAPGEFNINQPDGARFRAKIHGDEFQNWVESVESGHTILFNKNNRHWEYAEKRPDGTLFASGVKVIHEGRHAPSFIPKGIKPERNEEHYRQHRQMLNEVFNERAGVDIPGSFSEHAFGEFAVGSGPGLTPATGAANPAPVTGQKKVLFVLVNFSNRTMRTSAANWNRTLFSTTAGTKSVANYYKDNSYNKVSIVPAAHMQPGKPAGIVTVTIADPHPNCGGDLDYNSEVQIIGHALAQAARYVDFNSYDTNSNGILEPSELAIYFIYAGHEASDGIALKPNIWAHAWSSSAGIQAGPKKIKRWALSGELNALGAQHPMGVIAHEMGHALFGLPDLYDTTHHNAGLGNYSLMAAGSWGSELDDFPGSTPVALDAWSREHLGWSQPVVPAHNQRVSFGTALSSATSTVKLVNPAVSTSEYWLAENRYANGGWDKGLQGLLLWPFYNGGLLITHVDNTASINKYVAGSHQGVMAEQASTAFCNMLTSTCNGSVFSLFSRSDKGFGKTTSPNSKYYGGAASGLSLTNISAPGRTMTGDFQFLY